MKSWLRRRLSRWPKGPITSMSDADLGALTRSTMALLADTDDARGLKRLCAVSGGLFLIEYAATLKSTAATINLGGVSVGQKDVGDWTITICRTDSVDGGQEAPVMLAGWLHPGMEDQAIGAFARLTACRLAAQEASDA